MKTIVVVAGLIALLGIVGTPDYVLDVERENEHAKEYRAALALIDAHAEIWAKKEEAAAVEVKDSAEAA